MINRRYVVVIPESHEKLGLMEDLSIRKDVLVLTARQKKEEGAGRLLQKIALGGTVNQVAHMPFQEHWFQQIPFPDFRDLSSEFVVIIFDGALRAFSAFFLNRLRNRPNVRLVLVMINSMEAHSTVMPQIRGKIRQVDWNDVYTFDPYDEKKFHWKPLKNAYYSLHRDFLKPREITKDLYFAGGIKGNREKILLSLFKAAGEEGVKTEFHIHLGGFERRKEGSYPAGIHVETGSWRPYDTVLQETAHANTILEILQEGQYGPSLRYYEAVCYNKKLLTTNRNIVKLPFYHPAYMRAIRSVDDIDWNWVREKLPVNYHYDGRFSPLRMLDVVMT